MPIEQTGKALLALKRPSIKKPKGKPGKVAGTKKKVKPKAGAVAAGASVAAAVAAASVTQPFEVIDSVTQPVGSQWCWAACAVMVADFLGVDPLPSVQGVVNNTPFSVTFTTPLNAQQIKQMYSSGAAGERIRCNVSGPASKAFLDQALAFPTVVEVALLFSGGRGGHVVLVVGSDPSPLTGETYYYVNDPDPNTPERTVTFQDLATAYSWGGGNWNETIGGFELM